MKNLEQEHKIIIARSVGAIILTLIAYLLHSFLPIESLVISLAMYLLPYLLIGHDIIWKAVKNIFHGELFDECFLMTLATIGAFCIGEYPEAVAVMLFYQIGEMFQDIAVDKSKKSIRALIDLKPEQVTVIRNEKEYIVSPEEVEIGEKIIVKPGERIALDGVIADGTSTLNSAALTGESKPTDVTVGDNVLSGSINLTSPIIIKTATIFSNSTVAKIIELTENAQERKAKVDGLIKKFAKIYTPCVVIGALLLAIIPPLYFNGMWSEWINRALVFLVVSCPCALVISVPLSFSSGMGAMAKRGILIKGANAVEQLANAKTFVFDKTGTITEGSFKVSRTDAYDCSESELLEITAYAEYYSDHPIAKSIKSAYGNEIDNTRIKDVKEIAGMGISVVFDGKRVLAGNRKLVAVPDDFEITENIGTAIYISSNNQFKGRIIIADSIKAEANDAIREIKSHGVTKTAMLTGDSESVAKQVAAEVGIDFVHASLLPADKVKHIESIVCEGNGKTVFIGDGINDAPAIATADIGIAMGISGSDAAIDTADAVIMNDSLLKAAEALKTAKQTVAIARQNIWFSLLVKAFVLVTGALGLSGMWLAVFADVGVTIIAILNATRMLYTKKDC